MAKIVTKGRESVFSVKRFLGMNEAEEGEAALKPGEGAVCRNFRVTAGGALQKRPGSENLLLLTERYVPKVGGASVLRDYGEPRYVMHMYPRLLAESYNVLTPDGTMVEANFAECANRVGWFFNEFSYGPYAGGFTRWHKLRSTGFTDRALVNDGTQTYSSGSQPWPGSVEQLTKVWFCLYDSLMWDGGEYIGENPEIVSCLQYSELDGRYTMLNGNSPVVIWSVSAPAEADFIAASRQGNEGKIGVIELDTGRQSYIDIYGTPVWKTYIRVRSYSEREYTWTCDIMYVASNASANTEVRAIWAGYVDSREVILAACNNALWEISESGGEWTRLKAGTIDTSGHVHIFGFDNKAYILTGSGYKVWDGENVLLEVTSADPGTPEAPDYITDGSCAKMRVGELFNGSRGPVVFLAGDGTNRVIYSDFDENGAARADSFPNGNELFIGDANTPVTALIRHHDRLLCFKSDSAWSIAASGNGFTVSPMNRETGCCALGQARLVNNRPRTPAGGAIMEWTSGAMTGSYRNAAKISDRAAATLRSLDLTAVSTFCDDQGGEYWVMSPDGTAVIHNTAADAWYVYEGLDAYCMINYRGNVYFGTGDGFLRRLGADLKSDAGTAIACRWESGAMDLGESFREKYAPELWIELKSESGGKVACEVVTDSGNAGGGTAEASPAGAVPTIRRVRLRPRRFGNMKLILTSDSDADSACVVGAGIRACKGGRVR